LYFVKDMQAGEVITEDCVRSVRPGFGLAPKKLEWVIGQKLSKHVSANTLVKEDSVA
jgi:N-acetylneuraminate synthase